MTPEPPEEKRGVRGWVIALAIVGGVILLIGGACVVLFAI